MEELLNKLIEKGWKPRGLKHKIFSVQRTPDNMIYFDGGFGLERCYDFRQLTSKESLLRQFVCENGMVNNEKLTHTRISQVEWGLDVNCVRKTTSSNYEYRLIESSLRDESELEQFLLENIKIQDYE